jgi:hypothetical protein
VLCWVGADRPYIVVQGGRFVTDPDG